MLVFYRLLPVLLLFAGCASKVHSQSQTMQAPGERQHGIASWYGSEFKRTASGERYDPASLTAAHRTLPFGTKVRVTSVRTKRSVLVRINNRGPYLKGRVIDLSRAAAAQLNMIRSGIARVEVEVVERPAPARSKKLAKL